MSEFAHGQIGLKLSALPYSFTLDKIINERYNVSMKLEKATKRDRKQNKRNKMQVDNKSIFIIQRAIIKRGEKKPLDNSEK